MKFIKVPLDELRAMKKAGLDKCVPTDSPHYDTLVAYTHPNHLVRWIFWKRFKTMLSLCKPANRVLDFGSGAGIFLRSLSKNFQEVYSLDIETKSIEHIKKKFNLKNVRVIKSESIKLPFEDGFFDIIFAADVLEHIKKAKEVQEEFSRILKKGGYLIVSGPTENMIYDLTRKIIFRRKNASEHYYDIESIMKQTSNYFKIDKVRVIPSRLFPGFKIYRAINSKKIILP